MQSNATTPETSNPAIERWKEVPRTPAQYQTLQSYLDAVEYLDPDHRPASFKSFVATRAKHALMALNSFGLAAKEALDLIVIFGEGTNETIAKALRIEPIACTSNLTEAEKRALMPPPTMLEILGADVNPDLFAYICTLPVATTAQQFVDGCTNPAYLLIAMEATGIDWQSTHRTQVAIENLHDADAMEYLRKTCTTNALVTKLNAMVVPQP